MLVINIEGVGGQVVSVNRMSFKETPDWLNSIGFINRIHITFDYPSQEIVLHKGSLIFGFRRENEDTHGFLVNTDNRFPLPQGNENYYLTCTIDGIFAIHPSDFNQVRGIGAAIPGIPWYTFQGRALVGKIFREHGFITGFIVCDDAYWCEFEGNM